MNTLTGFRIENYIVTDESIYKAKSCHEVVIQFFKENGYEVAHAVKTTFEELNGRLNRVAEYDNEGFALISIDGLVMEQVPSLIPEFDMDNHIGTSIAILGFHEDASNMSLKKGIISSFVKAESGKRYIQFEASIKQGNSGSPVINIETGKIIGVVGYKLSAFANAYDAFKNIVDENLRVLKKSEGKMNIMDIDPIQVLVANQNQLKQISREFYKTAVMSYGFANEIFTLRNYLSYKSESKIATEKV